STIKMVGIGDSITCGYPYEPALSWLNMAANQFNIEYKNSGINGDTTGGMLNRFQSDVIRYKPSHVIIMGGTNDAYAGIVVQQVISNIHDMVELALKNTIIPIIGLPIPCNDVMEEKLLGQYREEIRQYTKDRNVEIIDFHKAMVDDSGLKIKEGMHCDGVHPNRCGYEVMVGPAVQVIVNELINSRVHAYYWDEDLSCTITTLKVLSEIFHCELHPQVIEAAYGLNAGRYGSQCGLVEGALMFIGVYAQKKGVEPQGITKLGHEFSSGFQAEFGSVLCKELRSQGFTPENPPHLCESISKRAVAFTAKFISKEIIA
ncbi:MAG: GCAxxG family protein, partial [Pelosinus sp.]|nr:GCAxxG family protein [Pelosinus sp.]